MSSATLKRGATARRPAKRKPPPPRMVALPVAPTRLRKWLLTGGAVLLALAAAVMLWLAGIPQRWWTGTVESAADAGFQVRHVELTGVRNEDRLKAYAAILDGPTDMMFTLDLPAIRERLRALPWVADASVGRRLPDTLVVAVTERQPVALWQHKRRLAVVDATGAVLARDKLDRFAALPLVVGTQANQRVGELLALLRTQPRVGGEVDAATFVGRRRWDLRFKSGETLALPEGEPAARRALATFARLESSDGMLGKGYARFDMRLPGQLTVRVSATPGARAEAAKPAVTI